MTDPKPPVRQMVEQMFGGSSQSVRHLEYVEVMLLRRYEAAHKEGDEVELARLSTALEVLRELGAS